MQANNIFGVPQPWLWECRIIEYTAPSILKMELTKFEENQNRVMQITMSAIEYFCGSTHWISADFCIEDDEKCVQLMQSLPSHSKLNADYIKRRFKLYMIPLADTSVHQIQILASSFVELRINEEVQHLSF